MQNNNKDIWEQALENIEKQVSRANFNTWFKDTFIVKISDGIVQVGVPNSFVRDWLNNKFYKDTLKALRDISEEVRSIEFIVSKNDKNKKVVSQIKIGPTNQLPLSDYYINKEDNLNPRYTFDNFVIGPFNELAHAASQAVIRQPGIIYNPLFIYGNTGNGKTHLLQAVGNTIKTLYPEKKVFYLTSEKFTIEYISSVQSNKVNLFKDKYRKYDVLIMDDIQFLSGKDRTQEELFHLFNTLYDNNKQIIFSSDKHPNFISGLEERLKSRFNQGMMVDISPPDHESRVAILKVKAEKNNIRLDKEIYDYVAKSVDGNIREIEGALNSIICQTQLKGKNLSFNEIRDLVKNSSKPKKLVSVNELIKIISDFFNVEEASICDKTRKKEVVRPRQIIMYIMREDFNISYPTIGEKLGGRDHTTVIHSCEKIKNDLKIDNTLSQQLNQIRSML
ncbi:MAG TPA: chromosomal replication initiator protein DnaA [Candidatus Paceibacterota bacterium]|nr:chromosomal replication initiator protein DnaA [Candidatus Paceibacterota bacterium]HMP18988.1 chromosomal replication initiator protein DnaA [Candidatus Paceibacterota bacterium]HMP85237.1 chromosomal replication initiator protein DnaA [Candidatus Paceibacterota bacterium]